MGKKNYNLLDNVLSISELAYELGTSTANIRDMIIRGRIPQSYYRQPQWKDEDGNTRKGAYIFLKSFIEYYEKNLKKPSR